MRRYRQWAGNSKGTPENRDHCIVEVHDAGRSVLFHQCNRKRGYGDGGQYCKQHAERIALGFMLSIPKDE